MERFAKYYLASAVAILSVTAAAKGWSITGHAPILSHSEPVFGLSNRILLESVAVIEAAIVLFIVFGKSTLTKLALLTWLSGCFILYRIGMNTLAPGKPCHCLGTLTDRLPFQSETIDMMLKGVVAYLLVGSIFFLIRVWRQTVH